MDIKADDKSPLAQIKDLAGRGRIWIQIKGRQAIQKSRDSVVYKSAINLAHESAYFLYAVWQNCVGDHPAEPRNNRTTLFPTDNHMIAGQLSFHDMLAHILKRRLSPTHAFLHYICQCPCQNLDILARSTTSRYPIHTDENGTGGDFDRFGTNPLSFTRLKSLPQGGEAGLCIVAKHTTSHRLYVFKTVSKPISLTKTPIGQTSTESHILLGILKTNIHPHRNIICFHDCIHSSALPNLHILQMEYCSGGDLYSLNTRCIQAQRYLPKVLTTHIFTHLIEGLSYLHHGITTTPSGTLNRVHLTSDPSTPWTPILHNDIKPENILLRYPPSKYRAPTSKSEEVYPDIVLSDFGLAGLAGTAQKEYGTYTYSAPEIRNAHDRKSHAINHLDFTTANAIAREETHTTASDIWAMGAVMYVLTMQKGIEAWYAGEEERKADFETLRERYQGEVWIWVRKCLGYTPVGRPTARRLLEVAVPAMKGGDEGGVQELPGWVWGAGLG